jgi:hypothetical protein
MQLDGDQISKSIPFYLTAEDKAVLIRELEAITAGSSVDYFLSNYNDNFENKILQGDGWRGLDMFLFESGARRSVRGIVLSNSCDIDDNNKRDLPPRIVFAPIVRLSNFKSILEKGGVKSEKIEAQILAIRAQKSTSFFHLPKSKELEEECLVRLDDVHSIPIHGHLKNKERKKLFTLSNTGFYMFVLKLSVHFCRLQENIQRKSK